MYAEWQFGATRDLFDQVVDSLARHRSSFTQEEERRARVVVDRPLA